ATCTPMYMEANEYGYASRNDGEYFLTINNNTGAEPTIATIVHETRHTLQMKQIARLERGRSAHPDTRIWAHNFSTGNYAHPVIDYIAYRHQPVELDADAVEHLVGNSLGRMWPGR
ncbi:MAG: hypothetical protein ACQSGP_14555, partial [Frankia sp.]